MAYRTKLSSSTARRSKSAAILIASIAMLSLTAPSWVAASASVQSASCEKNTAINVMLHHKVIAAGTRAAHIGRCSAVNASQPDRGRGQPPLIFHGGNVMATTNNNSNVVMTPIFWAPPGYTLGANYKNLILQYLGDVAHDSGQNTNVFSTNTEYLGANGQVHYGLTVGTPITTADPIPSANSCTPDGGAVYRNNDTYTGCVSDDQVVAEVTSLTTAGNLPTDLGHMYIVFTPRRLESCFYSDAEAPSNGGNQCTINSSPSAAYCAYHSYSSANANLIYGMLPFPIYSSPTGYTCGSEAKYPQNQSPNHNVDADVEISPLSHEMSEAITDPNLNAWYDAIGFENGDECAYVYGPVSGTQPFAWNQTVNGHHYMTQEEWSNNTFVTSANHGGCIQHE